MSNLLKGSFQSFSGSDAKPFVIDVNSRKIAEPKQKVIRSLKETAPDSDAPETNEVILNDALDKAKHVRDDAMMKAAQIVADAHAEADEIRQNAYNDGYEKGLADGNMEAMKRADVYLEGVKQEQDKLKETMEKEMHSAFTESISRMTDISCGLIEKFTGILVKEYKPVMIHLINEAIKEAEASRQFIIRVSEGNYAYVSDNSDRIYGAANPGINIEVYGDASLDDEQCIIDTDNGIIDLSMDVQIKNLVTAIKLLSE